jgi:predicted permease
MQLIMLTGLQIDKTVFSVIVIMAATPAASSATMLAEKFDCDATYASKLVAISTVLSIATMPIVVMLSGI